MELYNKNIITKWTFRLDADERLTSELKIELSGLVQKYESDDEVNGFQMEARLYFLGHKINHGCHNKLFYHLVDLFFAIIDLFIMILKI